VLIQGSEIQGTYTDGRGFQTYAPGDQSWYQRLYGKGVSITARAQQSDVPWVVSLLVSWLPFLIVIAIWVSLSRRQTRALSDIANRPREDVDGLKRRIDELQARLDQLSGTNKT
jgi:ATP-dependent Zn protease